MTLFSHVDFQAVSSPSYICDLPKLQSNLDLLKKIQLDTDCHILLALKSFAMWSVFEVMKKGLAGVSAASLDEARLGCEKFGKEVHTCSPAYKAQEIDEYIKYSSHLIFNSLKQWSSFGAMAVASKCQVGLRINPEHSEVDTEIYDPCQTNSRLGIKADELKNIDFSHIDGLHFHNLCNNGSEALARTVEAIEKRFMPFLKQVEWINLGGGHMLTSPGYKLELLYDTIHNLQDRYGLKVILEPGEAVVRDAGILVGEVIDVVEREIDIAILDVSATAHMPDILEMPYRPEVLGAGKPDEKTHNYRLTGPTCLAGDTIGDYSFSSPLTIGQRIVFLDMAQYTMVKNNFFNGLRLPAIAIHKGGGVVETVRQFGYEDFLNRLS